MMMYANDYGVYPAGNEGYFDSSGTHIDTSSGAVLIITALAMGVSPPLHPIYTGSRLGPYLDDNLHIFQCPSHEKANEWGWCSYSYNAAYVGAHTQPGTGPGSHVCHIDTLPEDREYKSPGDIFNAAGIVAFVDCGSEDIQSPGRSLMGALGGGGYYWDWDPYTSRRDHNDGLNVAFCDGHVEWFAEDDEDLNAEDDRMWDGERRF